MLNPLDGGLLYAVSANFYAQVAGQNNQME
jgi:hypothetical protein